MLARLEVEEGNTFVRLAASVKLYPDGSPAVVPLNRWLGLSATAAGADPDVLPG